MFDLKENEFKGIVSFFQNDIASIKTGRANASFLEDIEVEVYGSKMKVKELASVSVQDAKTLVIQPWDRNSLKPIEKAIHEAKLGLSPIAEKELIRIIFPLLTEERRKEYIKLLHNKMEDSRIKIRRLRDDVRKEIQDDDSLGEDGEFKAKEDLQKMVDEYNKKIGDLANKKEEELSTV
jgi:ribosome recycling factor